MPRTTPLSRWVFPVLLLTVLAVAFGTYVSYRQKYIGAADWYGYYQEGLLLRHGRTVLDTPLPVSSYPSQVPFGFFAVGDRAVPQYPPGFPLLLAAAGALHLEFFVPPLAGLVSCLLIFLIVRDLTERWTALLFALLWAFLPIVVFGGTTMMSDLVATVFVLGSYYAYRRERVFLSALLLGFGFCVRPTTVLYLAAFSFLLLRDRKLLRYALCLAVPVAVYGVYNQALFGAPWRTGYFDIRGDLVPEVFRQHLGFYLAQTALQFCPLVILFIPLGFAPPFAEKAFFVAWFAVHLLFYSFWRSGGDRWWWTRFLLPGYPPLLFLSAIGFSRLWRAIGPARSVVRRTATIALVSAVALVPLYCIRFGFEQNDLWKRNKGIEYYRVVREVESEVPEGSLVGSAEFTGSFRIYTRLRSFLSVHDNAPKLIEDGQRHGHVAYLLVEPWNRTNAVVQQTLARFAGEKVREIDLWGGIAMYRLHADAGGN